MTPRDEHPGRIWSRLTKAQRHVVIELYGSLWNTVDERTLRSLREKGLVAGLHTNLLTGTGQAVAVYRLSRGTEDLHSASCDQNRDDPEAMCASGCPVARYLRETDGWHAGA